MFQVHEHIHNEIRNLDVAVFLISDEIRRCLDRLGEIALSPNRLSAVDCINWLIQSEYNEEKPGFQDRIRSLEKIKKQACASDIDAITSNQNGDDGWKKTLKRLSIGALQQLK